MTMIMTCSHSCRSSISALCLLLLFLSISIDTSSPFQIENEHTSSLMKGMDASSIPTQSILQVIQQHTHTYNRLLEIGDFDHLNTILQNSTLQLQDPPLISSGQLEITVTNLQCNQIQIGDIQLSYNVSSSTGLDTNDNPDTITLFLTVFPFSMDCSASFDYSFLFVNGGGDFISNTINNGVTTIITISTTPVSSSDGSVGGFQNNVPTSSMIQNCTSSVNVDKTQITNGGVIGDVLNLFESLISDVIANQANPAVCTIIDELGETFLTDFLLSIQNTTDTWLEPIPVEYSDPLYAEQNYIVPDDISLLSLISNNNTTGSGDGDSIGTFIIDLIANANTSSLFSGIVDDPTSPTGTNLEINTFLRDNFLDDDGIFNVNFDDPILYDNLASGDDPSNNTVLFDTHNRISKLMISIYSVRIDGLDTMTRFNPFIELGQYTFLNELSWENVTIYVDLMLDVESSQLEDPILVQDTPMKEVQNITVSFGIEQFNVNASLFVAIDENKVNTLPLGALLKDPVVCILSALDTMEVSGLDVSIAKIIDPSIVGFTSPGMNRIISTLIDVAYIAYVPTLLRAVPYFFQVFVRDLLKNYLQNYIGDQDQCLSIETIQSIPSSNVIDYRDLLLPRTDAVAYGSTGTSPYGGLMHTVYSILQNEYFVADPTTGLALLNTKLISDLTVDQSGTPGRLFFPGNFINQTRTVRSQGRETTIRLRIYDVYINHIDTVGVPLTLLQPIVNESYVVHNEATIGVVDASNRRPLRFGFRFFIGIKNSESDIENDVDIFFDLNNLQAMFNLLAKISEKAFMIFPINDLLNLRCWLAAIPAPELNEMGYRMNIDEADSLAIAELVATVADLSFNISCIECTGPRVPELGELLSGLKDSKDVTTFANGVFNWVTDSLNGEFFQIATDRVLHDAKYQCPHSDLYDVNYVRSDYNSIEEASTYESTISFFFGILIAGGFLLLFVSALILFTRIFVRRRHGTWVASLPKSHIRVLHKQQALQRDTDQCLNTTTASMFRSSVIPLWIRLSIPVIIIGNVALFLSGHVSLAANISLSASLAGQNFKDEDLFEFSVAKSTIELWRSGGYGLALIIFALSFAWPYTKQLLVFGLWFAPPTTVSVTTRGSIFLWLDILGKWSIIDIFVLVIILVGFRISIDSPDLEFLPDDFYSIDLLVAPRWGLYSNMIAQILSQLSSHYIIHYHRRIVFDAAPHLDPTRCAEHSSKLEEAQANVHVPLVTHDDATDILSMHAFSRPHRGESDKLVSRRIVNPLVYLMIFVASVLAVIGSIVPSYSLNQLGLIGLLIEAGQSFGNAYTEFSVFSTITMIIDQASVMGKIKDYIGLGSLSALMILSVLIVPILQALVVLIQWTMPLTKKRRYRLMVALEALQAWQYMEVFLLAILITSWQLGSISSNLINPYCSALENLFKELSYYGILKTEDAQCFRTDIALESTFSILFVAAVVLAFVTSFVAKAATHYFRDLDPHQNPFLRGNMITDVESPTDNVDDKSLEDISTILPTPVLFTDRYRWFLKREIDMKSVTPDEIAPIMSMKSQEIVGQSTGLTIATPESLGTTADECRNIDTVVESDESERDLYIDESPASRLSSTGLSNTFQVDISAVPSEAQGNVANISSARLVGAGVAAATGVSMVRRGYDVDEDEWIMEPVPLSKVDSTEPSDLLTPTASVDETNTKASSFDDQIPPKDLDDDNVEEQREMQQVYPESTEVHDVKAVEQFETPSRDSTCEYANNEPLPEEALLLMSSTDNGDLQMFTVPSNDSDVSWTGIVSPVPIVNTSVSKSDDDNEALKISTARSIDVADSNEVLSEEVRNNTSPIVTAVGSLDSTTSSPKSCPSIVTSPQSIQSVQETMTPTNDTTASDNLLLEPSSSSLDIQTATSGDKEDVTHVRVSPSKSEDASMDNENLIVPMSSINEEATTLTSTHDIVITESKSMDSITNHNNDNSDNNNSSNNMSTDNNATTMEEESQCDHNNDDDDDHTSVGTDYTPRRTLQMN